MVKQNTARQVD